MHVIVLVVYFLVLAYTAIRILLDTDSTPKTLAYLLIIVIFPVVGIVLYFSIGINYRHLQSKSMGVREQQKLDIHFQKEINNETEDLAQTCKDDIAHFIPMVSFLAGLGKEYLSAGKFVLLVNGEQKFPEVLKAMETASRFIHMEYYDWENDIRGNQIKEILLKKAQEGVRVRVLYDDYASRKIKDNIVKELKQGGVEVHAKIKVRLKQFANRVNHRDHRKVIIIDGIVGFVGGINVSDRYDNSIHTGLYWRDTHVKMAGPMTLSLQRHFIVSWNSSATEKLSFNRELFPEVSISSAEGTMALGQVVAGGPIYPKSNIMLSYTRIFSLARERLYITNPYFIPSESIMNAMIQAAISGVDVRLLVPEKSDSAIVGAASRFYFTELLNAGVRVFLYKKGFVHAKTVVADSRLSVVGTANMDIRSFELNFEIMSVIYGREFAKQMEEVYLNDLESSREINPEEWNTNGVLKRLTYAVARLISSFL